MARIARVVVPGLAHHVTQRGNHQKDVFFTDSDREMYLTLLVEYSRKHGLQIEGYCLMTNHVHLVVVPERADSLAKAIGRTHNDYSRWLHVRQRRTGHLWQNRFHSCVMDDGHRWEALRYVELNPVRARMVKGALDWRWSSARAHCGKEGGDDFLERKWWREMYTAARWREALENSIYEADLTERLREATRTGRPLADEKIVELLERQLGRVLRQRKPGPRPSSDDVEKRSSAIA